MTAIRGIALICVAMTCSAGIVLSDELVPEAPAKRTKKRQTSRAGAEGQKVSAKGGTGKAKVVGKAASTESAPTKVDEPTGSGEPISEARSRAEKE